MNFSDGIAECPVAFFMGLGLRGLGCPKKIRDLIFPYFCSKSENLCIKTHPDQILGYSEHKSSLIIEVEVLLVCLLVGDFFLIFLAKKIHDVGGLSTQFL